MKNYIIPNTEVLTLHSSLMQAENVSGGNLNGIGERGDMPAFVN